MRKLTLLFFLVTSQIGYGQESAKEISAVIAKQESAWNRNDMSSYTMAFTDDGVLVNFLGLFWNGRNEIINQFKLINECCIKPTRIKFEITDIKSLHDNAAVVHIKETLTAAQDYEVPGKVIKKGTIEYKIVTAVFIKEKTEWKITSMQVTQIVQLPHK